MSDPGAEFSASSRQIHKERTAALLTQAYATLNATNPINAVNEQGGGNTQEAIRRFFTTALTWT